MDTDFVLAFFLLSAKNTIPKVFADSDVHKKFKCFKYSTVVFLKDPIRKTVFFLLFSFNPETDLKASKTSMSSWNELKVPSEAKVTSSANIELLKSFQNNEIPPIFLFSLTAAASNAIQIINKYADSGHPCLKPLFI